MKTYVGIDLGSTTTKAVLLDDDSQVIGRGITNSRSNYRTAGRGQVEGVRFAPLEGAVNEAIGEVFKRLREEAPSLYAPGAKRKSDFFRDIAGSRYHTQAEEVARDR